MVQKKTNSLFSTEIPWSRRCDEDSGPLYTVIVMHKGTVASETVPKQNDRTQLEFFTILQFLTSNQIQVTQHHSYTLFLNKIKLRLLLPI